MLAAMVTSVAQGPSERPPDLKEDEQWEDEDPLYLRQMSLATFALYLFAQVRLPFAVPLFGGAMTTFSSFCCSGRGVYCPP